jgi:ELWxxDGT repeat protein
MLFFALLHSAFRKSPERRSHPRRASARPGLEALEDRWLPSATLVADVNPGLLPSYPEYLTVVKGTLFFTADDGVHGKELWKSNGTPAGTKLVKDIIPGSEGSYPDNLVNVNGTLYFLADGSLWKSDGTKGGTKRIAPASNYLTNVNGTLYFTLLTITRSPLRLLPPRYISSLWKSNGTAAGTVKLQSYFGLDQGSAYTSAGGQLFFTRGPSATLWTSNGTRAGTVALGVSAHHLAEANGSLYFAGASNGGSGELWTSNGTLQDTRQIADINPIGDSDPADFTSINGTIYFCADDGTTGRELWQTDGTADGTTQVLDILPGSGSSNPSVLTNINGMLYFAADDGTNGVELWHSNGTATGTMLVKDVNPGSASSEPYYLTSVNGMLYFTAGDDTHGYELWQTDGTAHGTVIVHDIYPGSESSYPADLVSMNNKLYFAATDPDHGSELWDPPPVGAAGSAGLPSARGSATFTTDREIRSFAFAAVTRGEGSLTGQSQPRNRTDPPSDNDHDARIGTLTVAPGETKKTITIEVIGDSKKEADETFYLDLFGLSGNAWFTKNRGLGLILNDD